MVTPAEHAQPTTRLSSDSRNPLLTKDEQVSCFRSVRDLVSPGGRFVVEAFLPANVMNTTPQIDLLYMADSELPLRVSRVDATAQRIASQMIGICESEVSLYPTRLRYVWPSELDLLAGIAGFRLQSRWSGWTGMAFTSGSRHHISVFV